MKRFEIAAMAAVLTFATACGNTAKGVEKDADNMGDKVAETTDRAANATANAAEGAGSSMGAAMETADVKAALIADTRVEADDINVDTNKDTKTVTLNGTVPSASQKQMAEDIAKAKAPEYKVVNSLTIKAK
jgi:osmotically-inducible protein OsmY